MPRCVSAFLLACAAAMGGCSAGKAAETAAPPLSNEAKPATAADVELQQKGNAPVTTGNDQDPQGADSPAKPEAGN